MLFFLIPKSKIKSPFVIYVNFEIISVPEDNRKQNAKQSYTNKYQKHVAGCYGYKLVRFDDKFRKLYLGERVFKETNFCTDIMKKKKKKIKKKL